MSSVARPRVVAQGVSYVVADDRPPLFEDLTLTLAEERTGLVGRNGSGKTTLARLLAGLLSPTRGSVVIEGEVAYLPQDLRPLLRGTVADALGVGDELRALRRVLAGGGTPEDLVLVGDRWDLEERAQSALLRLDVARLELERPMASLSGGEQTRVAIAGCLLREPCLLLFDEPTNHLDRRAREAIYRLVEEQPGALYVSHDRELLARVDRIVELHPLGPRIYGGGFALYEEQRRLEDEAAAHRVEHAHRQLVRARREAQAAREKKERRDSRGKQKRREGGMPKVLLDAMKERAEGTKGRLANVSSRRASAAEAQLAEAKAGLAGEEDLAFDLEPTTVPEGKTVLLAEGLSFAPPGAEPIVDDVSLHISGPERVAITGDNGAGKTTLLKLLAGRLSPTRGALRVGVEERAWLDQELDFDSSRTVLDTLRGARPDLAEGKARERLAPFLFRRDDVNKQIGALSGGELLRLGLCLTLSREPPPRLLFLDEPTNHLDLPSLERLEAVLRSYRGALVVVSHDESFLERILVERRIALERGRVAS